MSFAASNMSHILEAELKYFGKLTPLHSYEREVKSSLMFFVVLELQVSIRVVGSIIMIPRIKFIDSVETKQTCYEAFITRW